MTLQATVHLGLAVLSLAATPTTKIICGTAGSVGGGGTRSDLYEQEGAFRTYANNVTRLILGGGTARTQTFALIGLTPAQVTTLDSMVGKTCLFRDTYGRRIFGSFLVTTKTDRPFSGTANSTLKTDVGLTFTQVTYDESV